MIRRLTSSIDYARPISNDPLNRGLVARWIVLPIAGRRATTWHDLTGLYPGTLTNMDPATDWVPNRPGGWGALDFTTATNEYVSLPASANFRVSAGTVAMWASRNTAVSGTQATWELYTNDSNRATMFWSSSTSKWFFSIRNTASGTIDVTSDNTYTTSEWTWIGATFGPAGMKLYINGVLQTDTDANTISTADIGSAGSHALARSFLSSNSLPYSGLLDDAVFLGAQFGDGEMAQLYQDSLRGSPRTLRRWSRTRSVSTAAAGGGLPSGSLGLLGVGK